MLKPLPKSDAQIAFEHALATNEYECHHCGAFHTGDELHDRLKYDEWEGHELPIQVCDRCIRLGWDEWGQT